MPHTSGTESVFQHIMKRKGTHSSVQIAKRPEEPAISAGPGLRWAADWKISDEFKGGVASRCKRQFRWMWTHPMWQGRPPAFFRRENTSIRNNILRLRARADKPDPWMPKEYHDFSSACVRTRSKRLYGYFEAMCRPMNSKLCSGFWLANNEHGTWTELDVMRYSTSKKQAGHEVPFRQLINTNLLVLQHPHPYVHAYSGPRSYDLGYDISTKPLKIALNWQADCIQWFVNDSLVRQEDNSHFHQPLYLYFDVEIFPQWFGVPRKNDNKNLSDAFEIFYIRTWHR